MPARIAAASIARFVARKPDGTNEPFALACRVLPRRIKLRDDIDVECLFARLVELVHGAGFAELSGKLRRRLGRGSRLGEESATTSTRRDRAVNSGAASAAPRRSVSSAARNCA